MHKFAVIVAGGTGSRMQSNLPKQFLTLCGKPVLYYAVSAFLNAFPDIKIVIVFPADQLAHGERIINEFFPGKNIRIASGGDTRFHSVQNGLNEVPDDSIVFIHDAVRCLVSPELIQRCYETALVKGNAIPVITPRDSLRLITYEGSMILDRSKVRIVQTPQVFNAVEIKKAFSQPFKNEFTDEATVAESAGIEISFVEGEENNIKITFLEDMFRAEAILKSKASMLE